MYRQDGDSTLSLLRPGIFSPFPDLVAGFTTRHGGVSKGPYTSLNLGTTAGDETALVAENRRLLFREIGFSPDQMAITRQEHGTEVVFVDGPGSFPGHDGMVTTSAGIVLCIVAADCAAVLLADPAHGVLGACHSGWRGTAGNVTGRTIHLMKQHGAEPSLVRAYVSPCISAGRFEVGPEVAEKFEPQYRIHEGSQAWVDLKAVIRDQLLEAGVPADQVEISSHCTMSETDRFFSYRGEKGVTGRMMGFIARRK